MVKLGMDRYMALHVFFFVLNTTVGQLNTFYQFYTSVALHSFAQADAHMDGAVGNLSPPAATF